MQITLSGLILVWNWVNNWPSWVKTTLIAILLSSTILFGVKNYSMLVLEDYTEQVLNDKKLAERYTLMITPIINNQVEYILERDNDASHVLLLNYHNTLTSTHGLSYRYLTTLTEKRKGFETSSCIRIWKELEYINYGDEIEKINEHKYLRIDSLNQYPKLFPNFTELIKMSHAVAAGFYPIIGIQGPLGMIVVLYDHPKEYENDYFRVTINPVMQPMSSLLDYNNIKHKFLENENDVINEYGIHFKSRQE